MGLGVRFFFVDPEGNVIKVSNRVFEKLLHRQLACSEFSGKTLKTMTVYIAFRNRKADRILHVFCSEMEFDQAGIHCKKKTVQLGEDDTGELARRAIERDLLASGMDQRPYENWKPSRAQLETVIRSLTGS